VSPARWLRELVETPAPDVVGTAVQGRKTREFRRFLGLWANYFS
jgi:hypothetical protein